MGRGSLRSQFLIPLIGTLVLVCALIASISWVYADASARKNIRMRLLNIGELCRAAPFPLTESVLKQIRSFSGIELLIYDPNRKEWVGATDRALVNVRFERAFADRIVSSGSGNVDDSLEMMFTVPLDGRSYDALAIPIRPAPSRTEGREAILVAMIEASERQRAVQQAFWLPALTGICATIALAFLSASIASRMVSRLDRLERQVNRIAMGSYETAAIDGPQDAIFNLAVSVNKMSQQLERARDEVVRSERTRLITMIASGMAHQLRNSLGGAILLLQTFQRSHPHSAEKPPGDLDEIDMALNQMRLAEESIRRLMTMSQQGMAVKDRAMSISDVHVQLRSYLESLAEHHRVALSFQCGPQEASHTIRSGETVVGALLNLIMNAIEAAGPEGTVTCTCCIKNDGAVAQDSVSKRICWEIQDSGPGPDPEIAATILEPFVTSKPEGVGLGLPTSARIAENLGGSLTWVREANATVFRFCIEEKTSG